MTDKRILTDEEFGLGGGSKAAPQTGASTPASKPKVMSDLEFGLDAPARGFAGWARDAAGVALNTAISVPEVAVGFADMATNLGAAALGRESPQLGKRLEDAGVRFGEAKEFVNQNIKSDASRAAREKFNQAEGIGGKFQAAIENPSIIAESIGESVAPMLAGSALARGFLGAAKAGAFGNAAAKAADTTKGAVLAGAAGEGAVMAGSQAESIRQQTENRELSTGQAGASLATGVIGAALSFGGGKLADRLGIGNMDTMLAQGKQGMAKEFADSAAAAATNPAQAVAAAKSLPRQVIEGAIVEGVFEELPQSVTETVIQNLALNKPWAEGLDDAIVLGLLSGSAMGAGAAGYKGLVTPRGAGQQQPGQAPDGGAPADVATDPGAPAGGAAVPSPLSATSQAQEPAQVNPLFDNATAPEPFVNQSAMEAAGFAPRPPEPVLDTQRLDRALAPQKPSEAMGLRTGPDAGPLENAAALSVDSGASPVAPTLPATAGAQVQEAIDTDTGEVSTLEATGAAALSDEQLRGALRNAQSKEVRAQVVDEIRRRRDLAEQASSQEAAPAERIAQLQAQADAAEATAADWGSRDYKPNGMPLPEYEAKGGPADVGEANEQRRLKAILEAKGQAAKANAQAEALIEQGNAEAAMAAQADKAEKLSVAQLAAISRKQIPDMTDGELVALASATATDHPRKEKLQKAVQKRGLQSQAAINEGAKADGTQTNQTQQAGPQPAQAGAAPTAPSGAPVAQGHTGTQGDQQNAGVAKKHEFNVGGKDPHTVTYQLKDDGRLSRTITYPDGESSTTQLMTDKNGDETWVSRAGYENGEFYPVKHSPDAATRAIRDDMEGEAVEGAQAPQTTPITPNAAPNAGVKQAQAAPAAVVAAPEPRAQRVAQAGQQWAGMTTAQRQEAAARANGIKPVIAKNLPKAEWGKLNADVQGKLADAMGTTPAQDSGANEPENQPQSAPEWWAGRSEDERRLLISVTNRLSGNAFANATTEWDSLSSEQKTFLAKEYDKYASGGASVELKAIAKLIARNDGKSSAPKPKQTPPRTQQEPKIKKSDAKALFSGKAMDSTRKAVPADARAMEQFIADGKEAEFQRLLSIRQTGRDNLTDEETNQFYDLRTERNQAKAAVENAGYDRVKPNPPPAQSQQAQADTEQQAAPGRQSAESAYTLPSGSIGDEWRDDQKRSQEHPDFTPTPRQQRLMSEVKKVLDGGAFSNDDVTDKVAKALGVSDEVLASNRTGVQRGDFGYDVYHARKAVEAQAQEAEAAKIRAELNLRAGDKLGTLIFNDFKQTNSVEVVSITEDGRRASLKGKRGAFTVTFETTVPAVKFAIERAHERGKRKDSYEEFIAGRAADKQAAEQPEWRTGRSAVGVEAYAADVAAWNELTPNGRRDAMQRAGVKLPVQVMWENMQSDVRDKMRPAVRAVLADDASATAPANLMQAAKDSGKLEVAHVGDKKPAKKDTKPTKEEIYNAIEAAGGDLPFADQYATVDALNAAVLQAQKNAAAKNPAANANDSPDDWHGSLMKTRAHAKSLIDAGKLDAQAAQAAWSDHDKLLALLDAQEQPNAAMQPEAAKASSTKSDSYGSKNTLVSQSRAEELRAKLREKAKKHLFGGLDTEMMAWGTELAVFHLEAGVRKFSDLVAAMASDLGTTPAKLKPYLRSWYNGARDMMEDHGLSIEGMDNPETVRAELNKLGEQASEQERETQDAGTAVHGNGAAPLERVASEDDAGAARGGPAQPRGTDGEQESSRASGQPDADGDAKARSRGDGSAGNDSVPARAGNGRRGRVSASGGAGKRKRAPGTSATAQELQQEAAEEIKEASAPNVPGIDFAITDELELGKGTESVKFADNLKAIRTLKQIEQEGRRATPEEQRILARYVGWGGLKNAFRVAGAKQEGTEGIAKGWEKRVEEVESLLTPAELRAARNSTTAAHYTSQSVVDAVWKAVQRLGFNGGAVLEPSVGTGNFLGLMPQQLRGASKVFAVEYDSLTARIAQQLYPNQSIIHSGLQNVPLPNGKFALAIGNPPFGKESLYFRHNPVLQGKSIHNQFFLQSLDALAPGGVMGMVVSHNLMDAQDFTARLEMAKSAQFLGAIRLPDTAFKENARTEVVTDIMLFRKRDPLAAARAVKAAEMVRKPGGHDAILESMTPDDAAAVKAIHEEMMRWVPSSQQKNFAGSEHTISVNPYFLANPKMVLGTMDASGTMNNRAELNVRLGNPQELAARLEAAVQQLPQLEPVDDLAGRTLEQFEQMATAMRLAVNRAEPGAVQRDKDGKLKVVLEMDDATGDTRKALLTEIELTKDTPFNEEYTLLTDGKWQRTEDLLDAEGKPVKKLKKDGTPSNLNEKTVVVYDSLAKIPAEDKWGAARIELVSDMLPLRDAFKRQMMLESSDAPAKMIEANRQRLAGLYKDFVKKHGSLHKRTTEKVAMTMPDGALVLALENVDKAGNTTPAEILSKRVTVPPKPAERAKDASEAVAVALAESGEIDIERIAQLLGTDTAGAEAALSAGDKPRAFFDPETNRWEPADGYLSGMVRRKLLAAKAAGLEANVKALEAVQPELWDATQITPAIGASWVPAEVYADFLKHLGFSKVTAHYSKTTNTFSISTTGKAKPEWTVSEQGLDTEEIVQRLLNSRAMKVMRKDADGKQYVDQEGTAESQMKAGEIANEFMDWAFSDDERRERLVGIFNEKYNTRVMRQRDGSHLMLPGKVPDSVIKMRPWQLNAVWRGITDNAVLYDHAVGAGKTFTAIARIMERRRMGLSKKPMVVVPNHLVEQWAADVRKLYPGANILAATKNDFEKARRRRLFARIGSGDYDMVIVGHSSFGFIDIDPSTEERYLDEELRIAYDAVQEAEEAAERDGYSGPGKPLGVAQAERLVKKLEERLAKVRDTNRDRLLTFEEMGIDDLTVDEAHEFKNLAYSSNLAGISGMGNKTGSQKALDLNLKIRSLKERQGTSVAFLTGTPISNSVSEMYLVLRNLMPQEMAELGFENFDAWRTNYVSAAAAYEPTEAGGVKEVTRLGREWSNMRSLMELYYTVSDAVTLQDMKDDFAKANPGKSFPVPKVRSQLNGGGDREMVAIKPNEQQRVILRDVVSGFEGLDGIKNLKERNATRLRLMDRARKVSLDARAVDPNIKVPDGTGKIGAVVGRVFDLYNQWESDKGTQLIFLDRSVPKTKGDDAVIKAYDKLVKEFEAAQEKNDEKAMASVSERLEKYDPNEIAELRNAQNGGWNAYDEIKRQLVAKGIPANEIRFVQEANTDIQKAALFADVNAGRVRVLIGSSPRMGAGTNVQERLVALHHVDVTWKPSDIEQREGRIVRQGNELLKKYGSEFAVDVIAYATEMTVDAKMWSLNATKLKAINGVRKYDGSFNMEFEDEESASMAEMAALATGNPLMVERVVLDGEIKKLEMAERGHLRRVNGARSLIRKAQQTIEHGPRRIELLRSFAKTLESNLQGIEQRSKQRRITIAGEVFTSDEAAMQAVNASIDTQRLAAGNENARYVVEINGEKLTNIKSITNAVASAFGDPGFEAEVNGVKYIDIGQTARAIMELHGDASKRGREFTLSGIRVDGMDVELDVSPNRWNQEKTDLTMAVLNGEGVTVFTRTHTFESPVLTTPSVNAGLVKLLGEMQPNVHLGDAASLAKEIDRAKSDLPALKAQAEKPFAQEQDLKQKRKRLEQVISTLSRSVNSDTESAAPVAQTETEAFKRWFGNSKVVDENGKPLVMYHGTGADFSVFDDKKRGSHTREVDARQGFFLTSSPEIANEYAEEAGANGGANIMPAYVSLQNPLVIDEGGRDYDAERFRDYIDQAQEQGHDGVLLRNTGDGMFKNGRTGDTVIAFRSEQIKSAIGNNGNFDPENPDIANFAANPARRPGSAQDKAVMQAIADGKSARDVLRLVANGSKDPFLRQVARLLLKAGITPNIQFGHIGKTKKGDPIHGQYRGESDTIAMAGSAEYAAERIFMHEAMHAATMRALAKPGLPRLQLQKLLEHVRKNGGAAGFYGLKNVDEFVAEVFTNPDFQAALRTMSAPAGSPLKSAWHSFVQVLRRILGLGDNSTSVLSQALELGVAAVREDIGLRRRGEQAPNAGRALMHSERQIEAVTLKLAGWTGSQGQLRDLAGAWYNENLRGKSLPNDDMGVQVQFSSEGRNAAFATSGNLRAGWRAEMVKALPDLIQRAVKVAQALPDERKAHKTRMMHTLVAPLAVNGKTYAAKITLREALQDPNGVPHKFYDVTALEIENGPEMFGVAPGVATGPVHPTGTEPLRVSVAELAKASTGKYPGTTDFDTIAKSVLPSNARSDTGDVRIVYPDGQDGQDGVANFGVDDIARIKASAIDRVHQTMTHPGKMSLWDRSVGTMRHIAERYPAFKPVYDAAQQFIDDVASLANTAANVAPRLIPRVDSLRDMLKKPISVDDNKAIAKALFEGTLDWGRDQHGKAMPMDELRAKYAGLNVHQKAEVLLAAGKVPPQVMAMWRGQKIEQFETLIHNKFESAILKPGAEFSDKELKEFFNLNGEQISLYKEARATVAKSLDITARAEMMRRLGHDFDHLRAMVLDAPSLADAWKLLDDELESRAREIPDSRDLMADKMFQLRATVDRVRDLLKHGYMPLSRFGKYTLEVIDQDGERVYFGLFEREADSNRMALQMRNVYKGAKVTQGTMNDEKYKLFAGITPETAELFGNMLGLDEEGQDAKSKAFQEYLRMAKNNHSALKRLIHRKGTAGYSEDVGRVLASFVYSNARLAATGLNAGRMEGAIHRLNTEHKEQGELGKIAMQLRQYIQDPQEEGLWLRGMLFAQYLGGSIASALVNTTQPFAVTIPWLSQYGGMAKASSYMAKAVKDMTKKDAYESDLAAALKQAEDDGVVSPQEIHQLMAQARGAGGLRTGDGTKLGNARAQASNYWEKVKVGWGQPFALAEQFNRRSTFIAAYRLAKDRNMGNPAEFARRAVLETQFVYTKANKPQWARGTIGGTLFTFKTYSVSYLELLQRMWTQGGPEGKRAVAWAMVMLMLMGGAGGLPFMEDAEDIIDGMGQMMGYNVSAKEWRKQAMADVLGQELAGFLEQGLSGLPGAPIDVSGRLGMGNLIPGTGLFLNKQSNTRDVVEMMGPAGDLVSRGFSGARSVLGGVIGADAGRIGQGLMELAPNAVRNAAKGVDMMASGMYKDTRGNKIIDTTFGEALWKMIGFQPGSVAQAQEGAQFQQRTRSFYTQTSNEIRQEWARAVFNKDDRALERVRERLAAWNEQNPELQIRINMADILKRVNNMKKDRAQRMADTAPRAMRQQMQEWAAQQR